MAEQNCGVVRRMNHVEINGTLHLSDSTYLTPTTVVLCGVSVQEALHHGDYASTVDCQKVGLNVGLQLCCKCSEVNHATRRKGS